MQKPCVNQPDSPLSLQPLISWWPWNFLNSCNEKYLRTNITSAFKYTSIVIQKYEHQELRSLLRSDKAEGSVQGTLQSFSFYRDMVSVGEVFLILPGNKLHSTPYTYCATRFEATPLRVQFYKWQEFGLFHAAGEIHAALNAATPLIAWLCVISFLLCSI